MPDVQLGGSRIDSRSDIIQIQESALGKNSGAGGQGSRHMPDGSVLPRPLRRDSLPPIPERLIVALDVEAVQEARTLVNRLGSTASFYKIGLGLFVVPGSEALIDNLISQGKKVFLDYKMFDIPATVRRAVERASARGISFVTVHGDKVILEEAVKGKRDSDNLKIFAISVLTSLNNKQLEEMGYKVTVDQLIDIRVKTAIECGCDGIIASAQDDPNEIRRRVGHDGLLIATPGIRMEGAPTHDHERYTTPAQAIRAGADYLVVGRGIYDQPDPERAARLIIEDMWKGAS